MDYAAEWEQEKDVLQSILTEDELECLENEYIIHVSPVDDPESKYKLALHVGRTPTYPEEPPNITIECIGGDLTENDLAHLEDALKQEAETSLGMAMSYTLSSSLSEVLSSLLASKAKAIEKAEALKAQQEEEAEAARTRGTPVTTEAFEAWRKKFLLERKIAKQKVEAESLKALTPKEREERRKFETRLTGRQLFEGGAVDANAHVDGEDESAEVDFSQYSREEREAARIAAERQEEAGVLSDESD